MNGRLEYVLDANVFIEAKNRYYAFEIAPGFWAALRDLSANGRICSIDKVIVDIKKQKDELSDWASHAPGDAFRSTNAKEVVESYAELQRWASGMEQYTSDAKATFASQLNSDAYVIAFAHAHDVVVVTQEASAKDARRRIKIPDACDALGVDCIDLFQMLRNLGVQFPSFSARDVDPGEP